MCSFVASATEFRKEGCPNCDDRLEVCLSLQRIGVIRADRSDTYALSEQMKGDTDRVLMCTTGQFDGTIALIHPRDSWVVSLDLSTYSSDHGQPY